MADWAESPTEAAYEADAEESDASIPVCARHSGAKERRTPATTLGESRWALATRACANALSQYGIGPQG